MLALDGSCYELLSDYDGELHEAGERIKRPEPKQDSLQNVIDDLAKHAVDYWECALVGCEKCPSRIDGKTPGEYYGNVTCDYARCIDIKRRLEAIQEQMGGDE